MKTMVGKFEIGGGSLSRVVRPSVLQRACGRPMSGGECQESEAERSGMMRHESTDSARANGIPSIVHEVLRSPGQPLDGATRSFMEPRFGHDFSGVRVHTDTMAAQSAQAVNALAYTVGNEIVLGEGRHPAGSNDARGLLAHELTHVVQQTKRGAGADFSVASAEREADVNSERIRSGGSGHVSSGAPTGRMLRKPAQGEFKIEGGGSAKGSAFTYKFGYFTELSVSLFPWLKGARLAFLQDVKLATQGTAEREMPGGSTQALHLLGAQDIDTFSNQATLGLLQVEVPKLLREMLTFSPSVQAFGKNSFHHGEATGSLGVTAKLNATLKSISLLPSRFGELTLAGSLTGAGSVERLLGKTDRKERTIPKATATAVLEGQYKSPDMRGPIVTLFGALGDRARITLGGQGSFSTTVKPEERSSADPAKVLSPGLASQLSGEASAGLVGSGKREPSIIVKIASEVSVDLQKRVLDSTTQATTVSVSAGGKF